MREGRQHPRLPPEASEGISGDELRMNDLDGDVTVQPLVARAIHLPHPALPQRLEDFIRAQASALRQRHRSGSRVCSPPIIVAEIAS